MNSDAAKQTAQSPIVVSKAGESVPRISDLEQLARWMDSCFEIPGLGIRFGFDALIGLLPGAGDTLTAIVSLFILSSAARYRVPRMTMLRMAMNIAIDLVIGSLPLVGDLFDIAWQSNSRNVALLKAHASATPAQLGRVRRGDWWFVGGISVVILAILALALTTTYWILVIIGRAVLGTT